MQRIVHVEIKGACPLLQNRFADEKPTDAVIKVNGKRDWSGDAVKALYRNSDGLIYQPSTHLEGAMLKSAAKFQIGGRGKKTYKDLFKSAIVVSPDAIPHLNQQWEVDRRAVIVIRARIMRERPLFRDWALQFDILIMDEQLPTNVVNQVLIDAGQYVGIGDYRPKFGRFIVTKFQEEK